MGKCRKTIYGREKPYMAGKNQCIVWVYLDNGHPCSKMGVSTKVWFLMSVAYYSPLG